MKTIFIKFHLLILILTLVGFSTETFAYKFKHTITGKIFIYRPPSTFHFGGRSIYDLHGTRTPFECKPETDIFGNKDYNFLDSFAEYRVDEKLKEFAKEFKIKANLIIDVDDSGDLDIFNIRIETPEKSAILEGKYGIDLTGNKIRVDHKSAAFEPINIKGDNNWLLISERGMICCLNPGFTSIWMEFDQKSKEKATQTIASLRLSDSRNIEKIQDPLLSKSVQEIIETARKREKATPNIANSRSADSRSNKEKIQKPSESKSVQEFIETVRHEQEKVHATLSGKVSGTKQPTQTELPRNWSDLFNAYDRLVLQNWGFEKDGADGKRYKPQNYEYLELSPSEGSQTFLTWNGCSDGDHIYIVTINEDTLEFVGQKYPKNKEIKNYQKIKYIVPTNDNNFFVKTIDKYGVLRFYNTVNKRNK